MSVCLAIMLQTPACGQLNRENQLYLLSSFVPENLVWRGRFSCPVPPQPVYSPHLRLNPVLIRGHFSPPSRFPRRRPSKSPNCHRVCREFIRSCNCVLYRWRPLPRVRRHGVSCSRGGSSNGWVMAIQANPLGPHLSLAHSSFPQHVCIVSTSAV